LRDGGGAEDGRKVMEKTFADKLREWTLYENAHPGNLRGVIKEAAEEIESLTAERDELKRRLNEEFANMDATMQGWEKLCSDSERDALEIESLTAERDALVSGLKLVRGLIAEGSMTGFNPLDGDWATRLFESQGVTYKMVKGR
jgi:regulator of replication initiation timing